MEWSDGLSSGADDLETLEERAFPPCPIPFRSHLPPSPAAQTHPVRWPTLAVWQAPGDADGPPQPTSWKDTDWETPERWLRTYDGVTVISALLGDELITQLYRLRRDAPVEETEDGVVSRTFFQALRDRRPPPRGPLARKPRLESGTAALDPPSGSDVDPCAGASVAEILNALLDRRCETARPPIASAAAGARSAGPRTHPRFSPPPPVPSAPSRAADVGAAGDTPPAALWPSGRGRPLMMPTAAGVPRSLRRYPRGPRRGTTRSPHPPPPRGSPPSAR